LVGFEGVGALGDDDLAAALRAAMSGDETGFAILWRALHPALLRYLRVVVGEAAEDVASETWLQAARDLPGFDGDPVVFRVWLFRIARHRGIDDRRRAGRRREDPRESFDRDGAQVRDVAFDVIEKSDTGWALRLIASLPPDQAEAVMLRVVAGLDVAQTAQVLGKRPGAVRVATMRGLRRLAANPEVRERGSASAWRRAPGTSMDAARPEGV
jgi:RNA polymerase sigma-70 factor (ECF subfamily)